VQANITVFKAALKNESHFNVSDVTFTGNISTTVPQSFSLHSDGIGIRLDEFNLTFTGRLPDPEEVFPALSAAIEDPYFGYVDTVAALRRFNETTDAWLEKLYEPYVTESFSLDFNVNSLQNFPVFEDVLKWQEATNEYLLQAMKTSYGSDYAIKDIETSGEEYLTGYLWNNITSLGFTVLQIRVVYNTAHVEFEDLNSTFSYNVLNAFTDPRYLDIMQGMNESAFGKTMRVDVRGLDIMDFPLESLNDAAVGKRGKTFDTYDLEVSEDAPALVHSDLFD
jgi:hypothetical protein